MAHGVINRRQMLQTADELFRRFGISGIRPDGMTGAHSLEERKLIEMARALCNDPDLFVVDETTTALSLRGRELLYQNIRDVRERNGGVIFISHDIDELMEVCDEITVLRDGVLIRELYKAEFDGDLIRELLVGRQLTDHYYRTDPGPTHLNEVALQAKSLFTMGGLSNVSFTLHKGEILGVGGLTDCGMHELGATLFGLIKPVKGSVTFADGTALESTGSAIRHGMGYISKNRDQESIILEASILDNMVIPSYRKLARHGYISQRAEKALANAQVQSLSIKCRSVKQNVRELSGGNKQKVAFGKWFGNESEIFILDCPTRGVDVGVKTARYQLLIRMKAEGKAVMMITEELPELIGMSDRILIMKNGRIQMEYARSPELSESYIIRDMI
jgi:ribose transport system ATP-binding protein